MNTMDAYLYSQKRIRQTEPSLRFRQGESLPDWQEKVRERLWQLLGLDTFQPCDPAFTMEYVKEEDGYTDTRFTFCSEEGYLIPVHVWIPRGEQKRYIPVICLQGHSKGMHISMGKPIYPGDENSIKGGDRDFAVRSVREGYAAIIMDQRYMGENGGTPEGPSCGKFAYNALMLGRTAIGERVWDIMRLIDVLEQHFEKLNLEKLICLGNSGGGTTTFYASCMEPRIQLAVPSCSVCTFKDSISAMHHCTCNYIPNIAGYFDMGDLAGLLAQRKLIIVHGKEDPIFPEPGVKECYELAKQTFAAAENPDGLKLVSGNGAHRFYADDTWPVIHEMMD